MEYKFPVFIREKDSGDIQRFESVYEMQRQLERIDVENEESEAWDSSGVPIRLNVQEPVWLCVSPSGEAVPDRLRAVLVEYAGQQGIDMTEHERLSHAELLERLNKSSRSEMPRRKE